MKSSATLMAASDKYKVKALLAIVMGDKNKFLISTAIALALEWASQDGEGDFDVDKFAADSLAEHQAAVTPVESPCEDVNADGECDTHERPFPTCSG